MKNKLISIMALCAFGAMAAQDTSFTDREIRDPKKLKVKLEANAQDAETRLTAAGSIATSDIVLTNSADSGTASIRLDVDKNDDAGDSNKILVPNNGGFKFQNDSAEKGTLADILAFGATGIVTLKGGATLDNTASATELNITETTVKVTGALTVTGTSTLATSLTGVLKATSGVVSATAGYTGTNTWVDASNTNIVVVIGGVITSWTQNAVE